MANGSVTSLNNKTTEIPLLTKAGNNVKLLKNGNYYTLTCDDLAVSLNAWATTSLATFDDLGFSGEFYFAPVSQKGFAPLRLEIGSSYARVRNWWSNSVNTTIAFSCTFPV